MAMTTSPGSGPGPRRSTAVLAGLLLMIIAALCATSPALRAPRLFSRYYDWRYFETMAEMSRRTVLWYHQAPLWNPYSCGGEVDLANPQSMAAAPSFLLVLLFGTALGNKLSLLLYTLLAMDGTRRLCQRLGLGVAGATLAALSYGLSGYLALHLSIGHINFAGVALYPYLLLFYERALEGRRWTIPLGLVAAWIAMLGGTFTPPMAGVLLVFYSTAVAIERRSLRPYLPLLLGAGVALLTGAVRLFPTLEFITDHPRPIFRREPDWSGPHQVLGDLLAWRDFGPLGGRKYWSHEYSAKLPYVLWPLLVFACWRLRQLWRDRSGPAAARTGEGLGRGLQIGIGMRLGALALLFALITMGNFAPVAPWTLLQKLPVLRDLRVPSRNLVLVTLMLAVLGGLGLDLLLDWLRDRKPADRGRLAGWLGLGLCLLAAADGAIYTAEQYKNVFTAKVPMPSRPVPFYFIQGSWQTMREDLFAGHGTLHCDEEAPLQRAEALDPDDVPQQRLLDPAAGRIVSAHFSPDVREVTLDLDRDTLLLINSNWNEHWQAELDRGRGVVTKVAGRLAVDLSGVPPGRHVITLRYAPRSYTLGLWVTALSLPLLLLLFWFGRRTSRQE